MTRPTAAFLGPAGTFTHEALLASARAGAVEPVPFATERAAVLAVAGGQADLALVPIENSLEGGVRATLDALVFDASEVVLVGEEVLDVRHRLVAAPGVELDAVRAVHSHPQALAQCARFLRERLPGARPVAATSTADAVREVAGLPHAAAIGTAAAAGLYGCAVLVDGVEDEPGNQTRFVWVARAGEPRAAAAAPVGAAGWRTSIAFHGAGDASPGWLVRCLSEFAFRGLNLTRIESRPLRSRLGHYVFLVDLEGRTGDAPVDDAIEQLRGHCEAVRVLGSYPATA